MKKSFWLILFLAGIAGWIGYSFTLPGDHKKTIDENSYKKSLHYTNSGILYVFSKEQGGLECLTGKTAEEMGCQKAECHAYSCDVCHLKQETGGRVTYAVDTAKSYEACKNCHGDLTKDNPDVHFAKGLKCMNCHTFNEIHGDGKMHDTYQETGFFEVNCKKCHITITASPSHQAHGDKLDCAACHSIQQTTCLNCHIDARLRGGKNTRIKLEGMSFLVNHNGKVTLANMLSYIKGDETMVTFAPNFGHSIKKEGAKCKDCHATETVKEMKAGTFRLVWWDNDSIRNNSGIIPVLDGYDWNLVFLDPDSTKWLPRPSARKPVIHYSGFCTPLDGAQFEQMMKEY